MPLQYTYYRGTSANRQPDTPRHSRHPFRTFWLLTLALAASGVFMYHTTRHIKAESSKAYVTAQKAAKQQAITTQLTNAWKAALVDKDDSVDIAVYDNKNGETAHYSSASGTYTAASIMKLSILEDLLLHDQDEGESLTPSQLASAQPMIENSDNDAATTLWDLDGDAPSLNNFFSLIGATNTTTGDSGHWGLTQTTALDQLKVMNQIAYPGKLLTTDSADQADDLLNNVESDQTWGVSSGVSTGVSMQIKDGWLQDTDGWDINSVGHIHGDGVDYTIAVLTNQNTTEQDGINTIESLSTATWNSLAHAIVPIQSRD